MHNGKFLRNVGQTFDFFFRKQANSQNETIALLRGGGGVRGRGVSCILRSVQGYYIV